MTLPVRLLPATIMQQPSPGPSQPSARSKHKNIPVGLTAGAEDIKYQTKYKDLKRKVRDIEMDNDKLHFKILQAKRNIQRMKLERAILYERLAAVPPSPPPSSHHPLPTLMATSESRPPRLEVDADYGRARLPESRGGPILETPIGSGVLHAPGHRSSRRMDESHRDREPSRAHHTPLGSVDILPPRPQSVSSPHGQSRSRPQSQQQQQKFQPQYSDTLAQINASSPPPDRGRTRRLDINELAGTDPVSQSRHQARQVSPPSMGDVRSSRQASVPRPVYADREEFIDREREHRLRGAPNPRPYIDSPRTRDDHIHSSEGHNSHLAYRSRHPGSASPSGAIPNDAPPQPDPRVEPYDRSYSRRHAGHDERDERELHSRLTPRPPIRDPRDPAFAAPSREWERTEDIRARRQPDMAMDVDSRTHGRFSPENRRYYDSEMNPDAERPRGAFRPGDSRSPDDEDRSSVARMEM